MVSLLQKFFVSFPSLMFSKISIQSFVYDLIDVFMFPDDFVKEVYKKNEIQKCFLFQNLTDADSTSLFFIFIFKLSCSIYEKLPET